MEPAGATSVFLFALLTAVATGLGALPFAFAKHPTRRWLGASNAIAAGLMLAASFGLIYEGMNYGPLRAGGCPARSGVHRGRASIPPTQCKAEKRNRPRNAALATVCKLLQLMNCHS